MVIPVAYRVLERGWYTRLLIGVGGRPAFAVEPIAEDQFKIDSPSKEFHFDAAIKQMTIKRGGGEGVFTKEK